jgi:hypothetical protein
MSSPLGANYHNPAANIPTELSQALDAGKFAVDGAQPHPFGIRFILENLGGNQDNYQYVQNELLPALESMLKRSMRVRPFHTNIF